MKVAQIYDIVNTITKEVLGETAVVNEDLSNIKLLEVDGDNVKTFDFANPKTKQNEILEVTDNEKSEHAENNSENSESTENSPQG